MAHQDILEQIVEEYLTHQGYFVQHNIKFRPDKKDKHFVSKKDRVPSDIDVLAIHPKKKGPDAVWAVNVKSWQKGFDFRSVLSEIENDKEVAGRSALLRYRELAIDKWARAYIDAIKLHTGQARFTHVLAVTHAKGDKKIWEHYLPFKARMNGNPLRVITLQEMVETIEQNLTMTPAATDIGRMLQLFLASGLRTKNTKPIKMSKMAFEDELT